MLVVPAARLRSYVGSNTQFTFSQRGGGSEALVNNNIEKRYSITVLSNNNRHTIRSNAAAGYWRFTLAAVQLVAWQQQ
jgi:hypothetical protein